MFLTIAMMRPGVKLASYRRLAEALAGIQHRPWRLTVVGDGSARAEVTAAFAPIEPDRIVWRGELDPVAIARDARAADLFLWPGIGEAYGLVYLEAQAMGLPAIAFDSAGVAAVVRHASTGLLVPPDDVARYRAAILRLVDDPPLRRRMGEAAMRFVATERTLAGAAATLDRALARLPAAPGAP